MGIKRDERIDQLEQIEEDFRSIINLVNMSTEPIEPQTIATVLGMPLDKLAAFNKKFKR